MTRVVRLPPRARSLESGIVHVPSKRFQAMGTSGKLVGVLGLDLGGTSGLAWWHGELQGSIKDTLTGGVFGFTQVGMGLGTADAERTQAEAIATKFCDLSAEWTLAGVPMPAQSIAVEDFLLRGKPGSTARGGLASPRLAGLVEGMLVRTVSGDGWHRYAPSRSKGFATSDRLRLWGLWCRGAPHSRDAAKQVAIHIATLLG